MLRLLHKDADLALVIGTRNAEGGSSGDGLSATRQRGNDVATGLARRLLKIETSAPISGFFMVRRSAFNDLVTELQSAGFKILADMLAARGRWSVAEVSYIFRERAAGESKMNGAVALEFFGLLLARLTGGLVSIRFVLFVMVGASGVLVQLAAVWLALQVIPERFAVAQVIGVITAMTTNFILNNVITYRDRGLRGAAFLRGLLSFYGVCSVGAVANVGVATAIYAVLPWWALASFLGAVVGAV